MCLFATPGSITHQEFSRQEYWSRLPFPSPGDLPGLRIEPTSPTSPALQADSLPTEPSGKPRIRRIQRPAQTRKAWLLLPQLCLPARSWFMPMLGSREAPHLREWVCPPGLRPADPTGGPVQRRRVHPRAPWHRWPCAAGHWSGRAGCWGLGLRPPQMYPGVTRSRACVWGQADLPGVGTQISAQGQHGDPRGPGQPSAQKVA